MNKIWIIPICLAIIGYFGIFWTLNLSNIGINLNMDNNTLEAIRSINYTSLEKVGKVEETEYAAYKTSCYYPLSCFDNMEDYLSQFPNNTIPAPTVCLYAVYCEKT